MAGCQNVQTVRQAKTVGDDGAGPVTRLELSMRPIGARIAYTRAMSEH